MKGAYRRMKCKCQSEGMKVITSFASCQLRAASQTVRPSGRQTDRSKVGQKSVKTQKCRRSAVQASASESERGGCRGSGRADWTTSLDPTQAPRRHEQKLKLGDRHSQPMNGRSDKRPGPGKELACTRRLADGHGTLAKLEGPRAQCAQSS